MRSLANQGVAGHAEPFCCSSDANEPGPEHLFFERIRGNHAQHAPVDSLHREFGSERVDVEPGKQGADLIARER